MFKTLLFAYLLPKRC